MTCECVDLACENRQHVELRCTLEPKAEVRSRDWDEKTYTLCTWCAIAARASGMFEGVKR